MRRRKAISALVIGTLQGALHGASLPVDVETPPQSEGIAQEQIRTLRFTITLSNPYLRVLRDQSIWLYMPVRQSGVQGLLGIDTTMTSQMLHDELGHSILKLSVPELAPLGQRLVGVTARMRLRKNLNPSAEMATTDWLGEEAYTEVKSPSIVDLAARLKGQDQMQTARNIFDWVGSNIGYLGYVADDLGALYALSERKGDCTEYAFLVVALARACQIQARVVGGYQTDRDAAPRADEYHNWAELYFNGQWNLVDAQKLNWLEPAVHYVAFRYFKHKNINPVGLSHRFQVSGEMRASM